MNAATSPPDGPVPYARPYLLVTNIPCFVEADGGVHLDHLWHKDFVAHIEYLPGLRCAAPMVPRPPDRAGLVRLDPDVFPRSRFVELPPQRSVLGALLRLPATFVRIWRAVGRAEVVHCGVGGWPYPLGWLAAVSARLRRRDLLVVVESATWRVSGAGRAPRLVDRIRSAAYEWGAHRACRAADLCIFTQPYYRDEFHRRARGAAVVAPATWIDGADVLGDDEAERAWKAKPAAAQFLYAGRMTSDKGVTVLLDAMRVLRDRGVAVRVDAIGAGELRPTVKAAAAELGADRVRVLDPVAYGAEFFAVLDRYHAVVVPSQADEQP